MYRQLLWTHSHANVHFCFIQLNIILEINTLNSLLSLITQRFKGYRCKLGIPSLHGGSLEITVTVPLKISNYSLDIKSLGNKHWLLTAYHWSNKLFQLNKYKCFTFILNCKQKFIKKIIFVLFRKLYYIICRLNHKLNLLFDGNISKHFSTLNELDKTIFKEKPD